jgi:hypothetical protein
MTDSIIAKNVQFVIQGDSGGVCQTFVGKLSDFDLERSPMNLD